MVFYNRQNVPRYLLSQEQLPLLPPNEASDQGATGNKSAETSAEFGEDSYRLDRSIGILVAYSLVNIAYENESESYSIHRLVQMFARYWLQMHRKTGEDWARKALLSIAIQFPRYGFDDWNKCAQLLPHVQELVDLCRVFDLSSIELGTLLTACSDYLRMRANYSLAIQHISLATRSLKEILGYEHPTFLDARCSLARIYHNTGRLKDAENVFRSSINTYSKVPGENHLQTLKAMMGLSAILREQLRYVEAETLARDSLRGLEGYQDDHRAEILKQITESKMVFATILGDTGRYQESLDIQRAVHKQQLARYGPADPRTLSAMHDLAVTLNMNGDYEESKALSQDVFKFNTDFYGLDHPRTWNIEFNLGLLFERQEEFSLAEAHFKNVLTGRFSSPKRNHPETLDCIRHLASCLEKQRNYEAADSYNQLLREMVKEGHGSREGVSDIVDSRPLKSDREHEQKSTNPISDTVKVAIYIGGGGGGGGGRYHDDDRDACYGG
jgi:tetratricopeptide (TPR) repeat protein